MESFPVSCKFENSQQSEPAHGGDGISALADGNLHHAHRDIEHADENNHQVENVERIQKVAFEAESEEFDDHFNEED